jgi:hypothetical protein
VRRAACDVRPTASATLGQTQRSPGDPNRTRKLTPIAAMSVVQIKRGNWSGGAGRGFVDLGAGIGGELSTGSAYQEPVQGGALLGRQGA